MEFGKVSVEDLAHIDFHLPDDDPRTWLALRKNTKRDAPVRIGVGAPVWGVKEWEGKIYPLGTDAKDFLYHYSRQFTSIELNTTHYRIPDTETIVRWRTSTPDGFKFCPKWPQEISHHSPLSSRTALKREFVESVMGLEDRLGLTFLQLPPHFTPNDGRDLALFLKELPRGFPLAVEFRHPAFFRDHHLHEPIYNLLATAGVSVVITDVAGRRDVLHTSLTSTRVLVRMIGNEMHPSDATRVTDWVARLKSWLALGLSQVEFFIHQPDNVKAPELIAIFIDRLNEACGLELPKWQSQNQGEQLGFF